MAKQHLPIAVPEMVDSQLWVKLENALGDPVKAMFFPITRYRNVLNRPRLVTESDNVANMPNGEFMLVTTEVEDVDEEVIFNLYKQTW